MTDAAQVGIAWSPPAPGERSELPGHRCKVGQILQLTWHACPRSLRAFAQNDQQKTAPVYFNLCPHARARGERRQQQGTTCSIGWSRRCEAAPASAVGIFVLVKWSLVDRLLS